MKKLEHMRVHGGYSLRALAEEVGLNHQTIYRLEKFVGASATPRTRVKLERFFGLTLEELLEEVEEGDDRKPAAAQWKNTVPAKDGV